MRSPKEASARANAQSVPPNVVHELVTLLNAGQWDALARAANRVTLRYPRNLLGWRLLGAAQCNRQAFNEAVAALRQLLKLAPGMAEAHSDMATSLRGLGKYAAAEASFKVAIALQPGLATAHANYGNLLNELDRNAEAEAALLQSLSLDPAAAATHNTLCLLLQKTGRLEEALSSAGRALAADPNLFEAWVNQGNVQTELNQFDAAAASYRQAILLRPDSALALYALGNLQSKFGGNLEEAKRCLQRAIELNPGDANFYLALGNVHLATQELPRAWELFKQAQHISPLITLPARTAQAEFSVLLLDTAGAGSTPLDYFIKHAAYACHSYCVMPQGVADAEPDIGLLRGKADVVINLIGDADNGKAFLPVARRLADQLAQPTVNHPCKIMQTNREDIGGLLARVAGCRFPKTRQFSADQLRQAISAGDALGFALPVIVRLTGTHGGTDMEKAETWDAVAQFMAAHASDSYYLIEYVDYRSADGKFRKYRMINVAGKLFPYHLAIHSDWLVHYFRTGMDNHPWMRQEEEAFLRNPEQVFTAAQMQTLRDVAAATQLDFSGIDCALDAQGQVLVFETNATMLVHDEKTEVYAYKNPYIARIKQAFNEMLGAMAKPLTGRPDGPTMQ